MRDDEKPTYDELVERVVALEEREGPTSLKKQRQTLMYDVPVDPNELLIRNSINSGNSNTGTPSAITGDNEEGTSIRLARADHNHEISLENAQAALGTDYAVTTSTADTGLTYTITEGGTYIVTVSLDVDCTTAGGYTVASLVVNGVAETPVLVHISGTVNDRGTLCKSWQIAADATNVVKVQAVRVAGGYTIKQDNSIMTLHRIAR